MDLIVLFGIHFLSDFVFQSREMGKKKSEDFHVLIQHAVIIWSVFFLYGTLCFNVSMIIFSSIYAIIHCIQDWYIWRGYKWIVKWSWRKSNENDYYKE